MSYALHLADIASGDIPADDPYIGRGDMPTRLYAYRITRAPEHVDMIAWRDYCLEVWGEEKPFFLPSERKVWRSKSSAMERVNTVRHWGGDAEVLECDPDWQVSAEAVAERRRTRARASAARLMAKANAILEAAQ